MPKGNKHTEEAKRKIGKANKGNISWIKGKHHTKETKRKISKYHIGRNLSEEIKKKISEALKRHWQNGAYDGVFQSPTRPEKEIMRMLKLLKLDYIFQFRPEGYSRPYDFYIQNMNLLIEYDSEYWHRNTQKRDAEKTDYAKRNGYKLLRITEENLDNFRNIIATMEAGA